MNKNLLNILKLNENKIIAFKYFIDVEIEDENFINKLFKLFNINFFSFWSTSFNNENENNNGNGNENNYQGNCFKIYWNRIVITPFTFFKVSKVDINDDGNKNKIVLKFITNQEFHQKISEVLISDLFD